MQLVHFTGLIVVQELQRLLVLHTEQYRRGVKLDMQIILLPAIRFVTVPPQGFPKDHPQKRNDRSRSTNFHNKGSDGLFIFTFSRFLRMLSW